MKNIYNNIFLILFIFLLSIVTQAAPNIFNFQAKIKKPDGSNLEAPDVSFRFKYINSLGNCTLYTEDFNNLSMTGTSGNISFALGNGAKVFPPTATNLSEMFSNSTSNTMSCFEGGNYTPTLSSENRKLRVEFIYSGSGGLQALNGIEINATPYAMYASSFTANLIGDVTGTQTATVVNSVAGKTAAQISTSVDDTISATNAATASRIVKRDGGGNASFVTAQATNFSGRNLLLFEPTDTNKVTIRAPATFTAGDYNFVLPQNTGAPGSVLSTDGTGVTSWVPAAGGSVSNVTASLPLLSSGGGTPNISMPAATGAVDGYLSAANFTIFNNKVSSPWLMNATDTYFNTGNVGIGTTSPTAALQLKAGTATAGTSPLKFTAGTSLTTPEAGAVEYDGTNLYYTDGTATRRTVATTSGGGQISGLTAGRIPFAGSATSLTDSANLFWDSTNSRLGVGTASPLSKVDISGGVAIGSSYAGSTAAPTNGLIVEGNVGIGVTSPTGSLEITKNQNANTYQRITNTSTGSTAESGYQLSNGSYLGAFSIYSSARSYGAWSNNAVGFYTNSPTGFITMADNPTGVIKFATGGNAEKMRIDAAGNVGIGTTSPTALLSVGPASEFRVSSAGAVTATSVTATTAYFNNGGSTADPSVPYHFSSAVTGSSTNYLSSNPVMVIAAGYGSVNRTANVVIRGYHNNLGVYNGLVFDNNGVSPGSTVMQVGGGGSVAPDMEITTNVTTIGTGNRFRFTGTGNLGIGTTTPGAGLDIQRTLASATGVDYGMKLSPTITETGTAGYTALNINATETTTGSGSKLLIDAQVGGVSKFSVDNTGIITGNGSGITNLSSSAVNWAVPGTIGSTTPNTGAFTTLTTTGNVGIGTTTPTATLQLKAGTAGAGTSPLKLTAGTNLTVPEIGAVEYDGTNLYYTDGTATRRTLATTAGGGQISGLTAGRIPFASSATSLTDSANLFWNSSNSRMGLGTATPQSKIDIRTSGQSGLIIQGNTPTDIVSDIEIYRTSTLTGVGQGSSIQFSDQSDNTNGNLIQVGLGALQFFNNGSGAWSEKMRIAKNGNVGIGTVTPGSALDVKGTIRLSGATSGYVGFSPSAVAGSTTYTLPSADGSSGNFLTTDGSGVLSWTAQSSTSATDMTINGVTIGRGLASVATNTALGASSLSANTSGANNTASGYNALRSVTTSSGNTATGSNALYSLSGGGSFNTATGVNAIYSNGGYENTANGYGALYSAVSSHQSTAIGAFSIYNSAPGSWTIARNTAVGAYSLYGSLTLVNNTGIGNVAIGTYSLYSNSSGSYNSVNGADGLRSNTTGSYNTADGHSSMFSNTTGDDNTASGYQSLFANTVGFRNTAIGRGALYSNSSNHGSTAVGYNSMYYARPGIYSTTYNTAVGTFSLRGSTTAADNTGEKNTALGASALEANTSGSNTTAVGVQSGLIQTTGSNNTFLGYNSGSAVTTGSNNIILGSNTGSGIATSSNNIIISDGAGNNRIQIDSSGNVGVGLTNPSVKLDVAGHVNIDAASILYFGGSQVCTASGCVSASDKRLKENIQPLQNSLSKILKLEGVEYDYKDKAKFGKSHQVGVIAQDVEKVFPEVVITDKKTGFKAVAYDHLVAPIIESIKALYNMLGVHDREIASVKAENAQLKKENADIKAYLCAKDPNAPICD